MPCRLAFLPSALKEWHRLDKPVRDQLKKKLEERPNNPDVPQARLRGSAHRFKIKLRASGFRLVYSWDSDGGVIMVIAIGRRDAGGVCDAAAGR